MIKLVTIYGGHGFVGRYIARRMAKEGWRVRVATRRPNEALFVRTYGTVGQVEPIFCNIRSDESVRAAMEGADAVVNCVGILNELGRNTFEEVHHRGAERIARLASVCGVERMVHLSAIGADEASESNYSRTKALGEAAVQKHFLSAMILRPSVIFGPEDRFFNKFAGMAVASPVLPLVGGKTRFQPVYVEDVAKAAVMGLTGKAGGGIYELGGPEIRTLRELVQDVLKEIRRRRLVLNLPFWMGSAMAGVLDTVQAVSFGLVENTVLTRDQVRSLRHDNVVAEGARGLPDLGITPVAPEVIMPSYLWRYRPSGQYAEIKESAKKLKV